MVQDRIGLRSLAAGGKLLQVSVDLMFFKRHHVTFHFFDPALEVFSQVDMALLVVSGRKLPETNLISLYQQHVIINMHICAHLINMS